MADALDVWDDAVDDRRAEQRVAAASQARLRTVLASAGFQQAYETAEQPSLQASFNAAFSEGMRAGMEWGRLRGVVCSLLVQLTLPSASEDAKSGSGASDGSGSVSTAAAVDELQKIFEELYVVSGSEVAASLTSTNSNADPCAGSAGSHSHGTTSQVTAEGCCKGDSAEGCCGGKEKDQEKGKGAACCSSSSSSSSSRLHELQSRVAQLRQAVHL
eukprot:m.10500 g.10500  ORF g.10500 m.10500 type:complete len:216 (+) comp5228_c0_seq1:132-779(+)